MKNRLMTIIKYFEFLYSLYYIIGGFALRVLKLFVKTDDKLILINCFGGKKYDDSPKVIYEGMQNDARFNEYKFVWSFHSPEKFCVENADIIKTDTLKYFIMALKARCWITNSAIERGLNFKGKHTLYFNTWHGTPIKKMGTDIPKTNKSFSKVARKSNVDVFTVQGDFEADIFSRVFNIDKEKILKCGLPRNDRLLKYNSEYREELKRKLNLPADKKIILYAPTFREFERDSQKNCVLKPPIDLKRWEEELNDKYCLLFRAHYEVGKVMRIQSNDFIKDMSDYPNLEDLMIASDILISDYSSIFFDFSIMDKPMLHFTYDYEIYSAKRGLYFDIREELDGCDNEDSLMSLLKNINIDLAKIKTIKFRNKYVNYFGNATEQAIDCIYNHLVEK